jgi:hypothetical protein
VAAATTVPVPLVMPIPEWSALVSTEQAGEACLLDEGLYFGWSFFGELL